LVVHLWVANFLVMKIGVGNYREITGNSHYLGNFR